MTESGSTAGSGCTDFGCNDNSPIVRGARFWEFNLDGVPNADGLWYMGFRSANNVPVTLDVQQGRIVGLDHPGGQIVLDTGNITGAVITLGNNVGAPWEVVIAGVGYMPFWGAPAGTATTYWLRVITGPGQLTDVCTSPPDRDSWRGGELTHAIVFTRDRYSPPTRKIIATGQAAARWANIACAGTVPAKLFLARHTDMSQVKTTDVPHRQSLLNAYSASVCPGSHAYTGKGEKLNVSDNQGILPAIAGINVEGVWAPSGAVCHGEWRLVHANSMPQPDADDRLAELAVECPNVPVCSTIFGFPQNWRQLGMVLTTNP